MRLTPLILIASCLSLLGSSAANAEAVRWAGSLHDAMVQAEREGKLVLIHFWSTSCAPCQRMENFVFSRQDVADSIAADYVPVKIDAQAQPEIARRYEVNQWPTDVMATSSGRKLGELVGERKAQDYQSLLSQVAARYRMLIQPDQLAQAPPGETAPSRPYQQAQYTTPGGPVGQAGPAAQRWDSNSPSDGRWGTQGFGQQGGVNAGPYGQQTQNYGRQYADTYGPNGGQLPAGQQQYQQQQTQQQQYGAQQFGAAPPPQGAMSSGSRWGGPPAPTGPGGSGAQYQGGAYQGAAASPQGIARGDAWQQNPSPPPTQANMAAPGGDHASRQSQVIENPYREQAPVSPPPVEQGSGASGGHFTPPQSNPYAQQPPSGSPGANSPGGGAPPAMQQSPPQDVSPQHVARQQPPANPPIALDGYCPVTLVETQNTWKKADPRYGAIHRGRTYLFAGPEEQKRFLANPDYYSPVLSGYDPVRFAEGGETVDGKRKHGVFYGQQVYLFADEGSLERFWKDPQRYSEVVRQAMLQAGGQQR